MERAIIQNQNYLTYLMNFDTLLDLIPFTMWLLAIGFISTTIVRTLKGHPEEEIIPTQFEKKPTIGLLQRINQQ